MTTDKPVVDSLTTQGKGMPENSAPPQTIIGTSPTFEFTIENKNQMQMVNELLKIANGLEDGSLTWLNGGIIIQPSNGKLTVTSDVVLNVVDVPIIRPELCGTYWKTGQTSKMYEPIIPLKIDGGAEGITPPNFDGDGPGEEDGPWAKGWEQRAGIIRTITSVDDARDQGQSVMSHGGAEGTIQTGGTWKPLVDDFMAAEQRRQTVQAEAMVNLAVGIVAAKMTTHHITFTRDEKGRPDYFRISITPQELSDFQQNYTVDQKIGEDGGFIITVTPRRSNDVSSQSKTGTQDNASTVHA